MCNVAHISWDKKCEYGRKEYLIIEVAKHNTPQLYDISLRLLPQKKQPTSGMRSPSKLKQRPEPENRTTPQRLF